MKKQFWTILARPQPSKSLMVVIFLSGLLGVVPQLAHSQVVSSTQNPEQIAILHWYAANLTTKFAVGTEPEGMAFDGANIWVANLVSDTVTELQASTGKVLGTFFLGGETEPMGVAFDGANIWTANYGANNVTKLRASTGKVLGTFAVGGQPFGMAFDGANIWVSNYTSNNVTKLQASTGKVLGTFSVGTNPVGVSFDVANIWVTNNSSNTVSKL